MTHQKPDVIRKPSIYVGSEQTMTRPRLFVDIDGVIIAHYGGQWQIRPYTKTLLDWAAKHFDIFYLSYNSAKKEIVWALGLPGQIADFGPDNPHALGKLRSIIFNGGIDDDWLMIEDENPTKNELKILLDKGIANRWIVVPDTGGDALLDVKVALENWLESKRVLVPAEWFKRAIRRGMNSLGEWRHPTGFDEQTNGRIQEMDQTELYKAIATPIPEVE